MTTTWVMKEKASGRFCGVLNARGCEQEEGTHYYADSIATPVTNPMSMCIMLTMLTMNPDWLLKMIDVEGAFLQGRLKNGEELYIEIPEGFKQYYEGDVVLWLNVPIYGTNQAAVCFYKALVLRA